MVAADNFIDNGKISFLFPLVVKGEKATMLVTGNHPALAASPAAAITCLEIMLHLYQSNRLENLLDALLAILTKPPGDPLAPEMIVVQNPGMARWLRYQIAEQQGIAANLEFPLPARFIGRIFNAQFGAPETQSLFQRSVLLWRILQLIPALGEQLPGGETATYIHNDPDGSRTFQLAGKLSDLFDQYQIYRPEMLAGWEKDGDESWQARLWRSLADTEEDHQGRLLLRFRELRQSRQLRYDTLPERVCLFGIGSLAQFYLEVLATIADQVEIHLFHLNPCRTFWEDVVSPRELAGKRDKWRSRGMSDASNYFIAGNPLLASLGKVGRDFDSQLQELNFVDTFDLYQENDTETLLAVIQNDILDLVDRSLPESGKIILAPEDRSLRFHICHSPLREIQVLHDRLLELFESLPDLQPGDILVMAPNIETYAPAISGVFGSAPEDRRIPWSVADRPYSGEYPAAQTFLELLDLLKGRFTVSSLFAFLETPAVIRRFELDQNALSRLRNWVRESGIRWGLDETHRREFDIDGSFYNSWIFGLDRLFLGFLTGASDSPWQGLTPCPLVRDSEADLLGNLADFLDKLQSHRLLLHRSRPAKQWQKALLDLLNDFFLADDADNERDAINSLRQIIIDFSEDCTRANYDGEISPQVLRGLLGTLLTAPGGGQSFLNGRVTFCNMVPMRSIPFRVIWLLGLNDLDFPRNQHSPSFDLIARQPQRGDRNRRHDDRYLFLEALLAARDHLSLSWMGRDQRDNSERPPSVVVDELRDYLRHSLAGSGEDLAQLTCEYPLQPFSPRCFDNSLPYRSYATQWLPRPTTWQDSFLPKALPQTEEHWRRIDLCTLTRFWTHPVRFFLRERLGMHQQVQESPLLDNEPFTLDALESYQICQELTENLLRDDAKEKVPARLRGTGQLPHGNFGTNQLHELFGLSEEMSVTLRDLLTSPMEPIDFNIDIQQIHPGHQFQLRARLTNIYSQGRIVYRPAKFKAKDLLALWVNHLALNLMADRLACQPISKHVANDKIITLNPIEAPLDHLRVLLELFWQGLHEPLHFYPQTSLAWFNADPDKKNSMAQKTWKGDSFHCNGESTKDWAYRIALAGTIPLDDQFCRLATLLYTPIKAHLTEEKRATS